MVNNTVDHNQIFPSVVTGSKLMMLIQTTLLARQDLVEILTGLFTLMSITVPSVYVVVMGTGWTLVVVCVVVSLSLCPFIHWFIKCLTRTLMEVVVPYLPGLCYTTLIKFGSRYPYALRYGVAPNWEDIKVIKSFNPLGRYRVEMVGHEYAHISADSHGMSVGDLDRYLTGRLVGIRPEEIPQIKFWKYLVATVRLVLLIFLFSGLSYEIQLVTFLGYLGYARLSKGPTFNIEVVMILIGYSTSNWVWAVCGIVIWQCFVQLTILFGVDTLRRMWEREMKPETNDVPYPVGAGRTYDPQRYTMVNYNNNWSIVPTPDDGFLPADVREHYSAVTGERDGVVRFYGSNHRVPMFTRRYYRFRSQRDPRTGRPGYILLIGSTFLGFPDPVAGVCIAPDRSDSDHAHLVTGRTDPLLGRLCVPGRITTSTLPVGSTNENFNPDFGVEGIGGATIWCIHNYEDPIKSILAVADHNNTEVVFVVLHVVPGILTYKEGNFPWSDQTWRHLDDGYTERRWPRTTGLVIRHNTQIYMEHLITDYVQTSPGTYFVSHVNLNLMDTVLIQWTRTNTPPTPTRLRRFTLEKPHSYHEIPLVKVDEVTNEIKISGYPSTVHHQEFINTATDVGTAQMNVRALNDNYQRNRNRTIPHMTPREVSQMYDARMLTEHCRSFLDSTDNQSILNHIVGFTNQDPVQSRLVRAALNRLTDQPPTHEDVEMIRQEQPYMSKLAGGRPCRIDRCFKLPTYDSGNNNVLSQMVLDDRPANDILELVATGPSEAACLVNSIYGKTDRPGAILPCGMPVHGGSCLSSNGHRLLATEIEFLMNESKVVFIVLEQATDDQNDRAVKYFGAQIPDAENSVRQPIIFIDKGRNLCGRVHYPKHMTVLDVVHHYGAVWTDFEGNSDWLPNDGDERIYAAPTGVADIFAAYQEAEAVKAARKSRKEITEEELDAIKNTARSQPYLTYQLPNGDRITRGDIPVLLQPKYGKIYDQLNDVEGSPYPAPHHFAGRPVSVMRGLRK